MQWYYFSSVCIFVADVFLTTFHFNMKHADHYSKTFRYHEREIWTAHMLSVESWSCKKKLSGSNKNTKIANLSKEKCTHIKEQIRTQQIAGRIVVSKEAMRTENKQRFKIKRKLMEALQKKS